MIKVQINGLRQEPYTVPITGKREGLKPGDMRFAYIAKEETVQRVKAYARKNKISIKDAMEHLVTQSLEAAEHE